MDRETLLRHIGRKRLRHSQLNFQLSPDVPFFAIDRARQSAILLLALVMSTFIYLSVYELQGTSDLKTVTSDEISKTDGRRAQANQKQAHHAAHTRLAKCHLKACESWTSERMLCHRKCLTAFRVTKTRRGSGYSGKPVFSKMAVKRKGRFHT